MTLLFCGFMRDKHMTGLASCVICCARVAPPAVSAPVGGRGMCRAARSGQTIVSRREFAPAPTRVSVDDKYGV